jgi:hypothetical protein
MPCSTATTRRIFTIDACCGDAESDHYGCPSVRHYLGCAKGGRQHPAVQRNVNVCWAQYPCGRYTLSLKEFKLEIFACIDAAAYEICAGEHILSAVSFCETI